MTPYGPGFRIIYVDRVEEYRLLCEWCGLHVMGTDDRRQLEKGAMKEFVANHRAWCTHGVRKWAPVKDWSEDG